MAAIPDHIQITSSTDLYYVFYYETWLLFKAKPNVYRFQGELNSKSFHQWLESTKKHDDYDNWIVDASYQKEIFRTHTRYESVDDNVYLTYTMMDGEDFITDLRFFIHPKISLSEFEEKYILPDLKKLVKKSKGGLSTYYTIGHDERGHYELRPVSKKIKPVNIELNYGKDFLETDNNIISLFKKNKTGLFVFEGQPGTGKTTYIRRLIKKLSKKKNFVFCPINMFEHITEPAFINFLSHWPDTVLILEDAEKLLASRDLNATSAISTLLNLTDGLMGDALEMQIIATYNTKEKSNLDSALFREGRLLVNYEFRKRRPEEANQIWKVVYGEEKEFEEEVALSEIYNKPAITNNKIEISDIGFKNN